MFSWSKKNEKKPRRRAGGGGPVLNEFGLPVSQGNQGGQDEELEAELRALTGGVISLEEDLELNDEGSDVEAEFAKLFGQTKGKKKKSKKGGGKSEVTAAVEDSDMNMGADMNMKDEDIGGDEEDLEVDENDPELLGELMGLTEADDEEEEEEEDEEESEEKEPEKKEVTVTSMLQERLAMYKAAEAKAKENNESSRARRFGRGIKTLQQLIKKAEAGQPVLPSEIPPVIATNLKPAPPPAPAPPPPPEPAPEDATENVPESDVPAEDMRGLRVDDNPPQAEDLPEQPKPVRVAPPPPQPVSENPWLAMLTARRDEYKASALTAKKNNDLETALKHVKCVKQLNALIAAVEQGQDIDESEIPPSLSAPPARKTMETVTPLKFEAPEEVEIDEYDIPITVMDALNQRLRIYQRFLRNSESAGDETGIKRNSKIVQIYSEAIKLHRAGKRVPLLKLPTPPGCPPIPIPFEVFDQE
ncbi:UNVERIFIED_CONTAM: hypothetical protein PYX00_002826 [Menopon gallinae]|uniref:DM14 domain-containing protein n=1 Tax=Menopon gallinae TaxID=328185 RepID=A0AAW2HY70_9NEOP